MRLVVAIITPDPAVERLAQDRRELLIPEQFKRNGHELLGGAQVNLICMRADESVTPMQVLSHFDYAGDSSVVGILAVIDQRLVGLAPALKDYFFCVEYGGAEKLASPANFFGSLFKRAINDYRAFATRFDDKKFRHLFTLPIRNFHAKELTTLRETCTNTTSKSGFAVRLDNSLSALRARQRPKRFTDSPEIYVVDEDEKHFKLGHERHAQAETAMPPHTLWCVVGNAFRFGRRFDSRLHYNVSRGRQRQLMRDDYPNCHGEPTPGEGRKHLNMFTNDYF